MGEKIVFEGRDGESYLISTIRPHDMKDPKGKRKT